MMKNRINVVTTIVLALKFFALSPIAHAVSPPPDGGYPGGNTAEGQNALLSLTTGTYNTAIGFDSLLSLNTGSLCTAVGAGTLLVSTGSENTATGAGALLNNTTGGNNTAVGTFVLVSNTEGSSNVAVGDQALFSNTTGAYNTAVGGRALLQSNNGDNNTAIGGLALFSNTNGSVNTANGMFALYANTTGTYNVAIGSEALSGNVSGSYNIGIGHQGGFAITTAHNVIAIGAPGENVDHSCYIGEIFGATSSNGVGVLVNSNGRLGTVTSSMRFKQDIKPMDNVSQGLFALKPVAFRYKKEIDPAGISQLGLVAEDVEKVNPDLVVRDKEGKPYSVRYDQVNAMLLNEFLKEHRKVEQQEGTIIQVEKEIQAIVAHSKQQDLELQSVHHQIEMNRSDARITSVNN